MLTGRGIIFESEPLAEFIREDRYGHPVLFPPHNLQDEDLWFGAGCLNDEADTQVYAVADDEGVLMGLVLLTDTRTEAWVQETGKWEVVEEA